MRKIILPSCCLILLFIAFPSDSATVKVDVLTPEQVPHQFSLELSGTIAAAQDAQLAPLEAGLIQSIYVESGDTVTQGQVLLSLDDTLAKLRLAQVEAREIAAQIQQQEALRQYDEVVSLAKSKVVADSLLSERKANLASANAELTNTQAQVALQKEIVKRHKLVAPFNGTIAKRHVDIGEWVGQQNQLFQLVSNQSLRLLVDLPQEHLNTLSSLPKVTAVVIPDVMPNKQFELSITSIVPVSESVSRTVQLRIDLPSNELLVPGMSARARVNLSNQNQLLSWVPRSALKRHPDGGNSIFVVNGDKVKRFKITILKSDAEKLAVSGLPKGATIVVSGTELLKDNQTVVVVNSTAAIQGVN
ncbi:efflux RND transporter periplasmic adaptor subunit [Aliikangiella marina]|uniref:Efflux RND transporter periplasmic adaptor subunit n=1 Tax=Aliikangiella marina TaxID=1712262 RepID=A0A545TC89_9GAMM|nr:efflux RND transporter periplasmic adaptor subunit [Aliikangiella marina]TQV74829.1 efflux RND transporter periplasmic adaptor subunit [Aliikangiella marina]